MLSKLLQKLTYLDKLGSVNVIEIGKVFTITIYFQYVVL